MKLKYEEIKFLNNENYYYLCTLYTHGEIKINNLDYIYKPQENIYCFDLANAIFDNLSEDATTYIDNIFNNGPEQIKNERINKKRWFDHKYFEEHEVNEHGVFIKKNFKPINLGKAHLYLNDGIKELSEEDVYNTKIPNIKKGKKKLAKVKFASNYEEIKNLYNNINLFHSNILKYWDKNVEEYISYTIEVDDELELVRNFFELIFSSTPRFIIKKCKNCNKYFITTDTNRKSCDRLFKGNTSCSNFVNEARIQFKNNDTIHKLEERVRKAIGNNIEKSNEFSLNRKEKKRKKNILIIQKNMLNGY